jgi:hypothetical protein
LRFRSFRHPDTWRGLGLEAAAYLKHPPPLSEERLSWELPEDQEIRVSWPQQYDWQQTDKWIGAIADAMQGLASVQPADIPQRFPRIVIAEVVHDGERRRLALDYADNVGINGACLDEVDVYFKMQFRREGYEPHQVVPGGFVANGRSLLRYLPWLRRLRERRSRHYDVYGAFSHGYASDVRRVAVELLLGQTRFAYEGGFDLARYSAHLVKTARAKVCVDLPGNGPLCFRLVDYLAIGTAIVAAPHEARLHVPLIDGEHLVHARADLADLPAIAASLVEDEGRRERLANAARTYYDRYLHPRQLAAYYLHTTLKLTS